MYIYGDTDYFDIVAGVLQNFINIINSNFFF